MLCIELAAIVQFYVFGQKVPVAKPAPIFFWGLAMTPKTESRSSFCKVF
jgi:hypothetical protein